MPLMYKRLQGQHRLRLFVDASSVKEGVPTAHTGFAIFSAPGSVPRGRMPADSPLVLLQYGSHRQRKVTHFSFAAEVYAMLDGLRAAKELAVVHALVNHGNEYKQAPIDVYTDTSPSTTRSTPTGWCSPRRSARLSRSFVSSSTAAPWQR